MSGCSCCRRAESDLHPSLRHLSPQRRLLPGTRAVVTDTDGESVTGANRLYEKAGMAVFRREYAYEKEVSPGEELRLLSVANLHSPLMEVVQ